MADGQLESIWSQLLYAKRTLSPFRLQKPIFPVMEISLVYVLHTFLLT